MTCRSKVAWFSLGLVCACSHILTFFLWWLNVLRFNEKGVSDNPYHISFHKDSINSESFISYAAMGCTFFHYWPALPSGYSFDWLRMIFLPLSPSGYFVLYVINFPPLSSISVIIYRFVFCSFHFFVFSLYIHWFHGKGISALSPIGSYRQTPSGAARDTQPNVTISWEARPGRTCAAGSMTTVNWIFRAWPPSGTCSITVLIRLATVAVIKG